MKTPNEISYTIPKRDRKSNHHVKETVSKFHHTIKTKKMGTKIITLMVNKVRTKTKIDAMIIDKQRIYYVCVKLSIGKSTVYGLARCSQQDKYNPDKGRDIARTKAMSLFKKFIKGEAITAHIQEDRLRTEIIIIPNSRHLDLKQQIRNMARNAREKF